MWAKSKKLDALQKQARRIPFPSDTGGIGKNVFTKVISTKAAELRLIWFSLMPAILCPGLVNDIAELEMYLDFAAAVRILDSPAISESKAKRAHVLLGSAVKSWTALFGEESVRPNMHIAAHIEHCIKQCGPVDNFSCWALERYQRDTISHNTNHRRIETQYFNGQTEHDRVENPANYFACASQMRPEENQLLEDFKKQPNVSRQQTLVIAKISQGLNNSNCVLVGVTIST